MGFPVHVLSCPGQIILSGTRNAIEDFSEVLKKNGARSVIDLNVSAPFHCSLMNKASKIMEEVLKDTDFLNEVYYCEFRKKLWYFIEIFNLYKYFKKKNLVIFIYWIKFLDQQ